MPVGVYQLCIDWEAADHTEKSKPSVSLIAHYADRGQAKRFVEEKCKIECDMLAQMLSNIEQQYEIEYGVEEMNDAIKEELEEKKQTIIEEFCFKDPKYLAHRKYYVEKPEQAALEQAVAQVKKRANRRRTLF
jgi:hypothetical protein